MARFPKISQWKQLFKVLKGTERKIFLVFFALTIVSAIYLVVYFYISNTKTVPAYGGVYTEGVIGQPRYINPIYGETNDIDRTLIDLVYSGLMTYDKDGNIVNDLIKDYQISENGKIYTFQLKENLYWQDGIPLTSDDVIYTIKTIQNSDYKSPLRANWLDVAVEKISKNSFAFGLNSPYNSFLENCTVKIIPQHIWQNIPAENFALSSYNLQPIGSGPYILSDLQENNDGFIKSLILNENNKYYGKFYEKLPYISKIYFQFFKNREDLISAANKKTIDGFSVSDIENNEILENNQIRQGWTTNEKFKVYSFSIPRYFALFLNVQNSKIFSDTNINQALNYSINKEELLKKINNKGNISIVNSPILPEYFFYDNPKINYNFDTDKAKNLLDKSGYKDNGQGERIKLNTKKSAFQFKSYLKVGSTGNEVVELQGCLSRLDDNFKNILKDESNGKYGKGTEYAVDEFQKKYFPDTQSTGETGAATRKKLNELCFSNQSNSLVLRFTITTINQPQLINTANVLKDYWQKIGIKVEIKPVELSELKNVIKNRDYDALLYGEALGSLPDLYPFWHSTQINDPGLNLSGYQNKKADQLLKESREALDNEIKAKKLQDLQNIILSDAPAIFLYNPNYLYWVSEKIKGIDTTKIVDPSKRFKNINNWYINTKRTWK